MVGFADVELGTRLASTTREKAPMPRSRTTVQVLFKTAPHSHSDAGVRIVGVAIDVGDAAIDAEVSCCNGEVFNGGGRGVMAGSEMDVEAAKLSSASDSGSSVGNRSGGFRAHFDDCESVGLCKGESRTGEDRLGRLIEELAASCTLVCEDVRELSAAERKAEGKFDKG